MALAFGADDVGKADDVVERGADVVAEVCELASSEATALLDRAWQVHHRAWIEGKQYGSPGVARYCLDELGLDGPGRLQTLQRDLEEAGRLGRPRALEGAVDCLLAIRKAGIRTALVCDAGFTPGRIVRDFLDRAGLLDLLEFCAFSDEVGEPKPNASIFRAALEAIGTEAADAVHVGDLLRTDVQGGRNIGMRTVRITDVSDDAARGFSWNPDPGSIAPQDAEAPRGPVPFEDADEVVSSHHELPGALERLGARLA
jgi:FMN phosphatase YigB (HAD superfamily)